MRVQSNCLFLFSLNFFQQIGLSFVEGIADSMKNIVVLFYLDSEMNKMLEAKREKASLDPSKKSSRDKEKKAE